MSETEVEQAQIEQAEAPVEEVKSEAEAPVEEVKSEAETETKSQPETKKRRA